MQYSEVQYCNIDTLVQYIIVHKMQYSEVKEIYPP